MPIYEYRCDNCGSQWEDMQKISDGPTEICPECGEHQAHRLISRTNFVLKGSGWYVTDYGKGTGGRAGEKKSSKKTSTQSDTPKETSKNTTKTESSSSSAKTTTEKE